MLWLNHAQISLADQLHERAPPRFLLLIVQQTTPQRVTLEGVTPHIFGEFFQALNLRPHEHLGNLFRRRRRERET